LKVAEELKRRHNEDILKREEDFEKEREGYVAECDSHAKRIEEYSKILNILSETVRNSESQTQTHNDTN
jgi:hypothetical protein